MTHNPDHTPLSDQERNAIIEKGMNTERHVIGYDTHINRDGRWARWGGL